MSSKSATAPESLLDELQSTLAHGTVARRVETLRRVTDLFINGAVDYSDDQLAEGLVDIVAEFDVKPYDVAALVPIVEEAGGRLTSVTGDVELAHGSSLATNGLLHDAVVRALR